MEREQQTSRLLYIYIYIYILEFYCKMQRYLKRKIFKKLKSWHKHYISKTTILRNFSLIFCMCFIGFRDSAEQGNEEPTERVIGCEK